MISTPSQARRPFSAVYYESHVAPSSRAHRYMWMPLSPGVTECPRILPSAPPRVRSGPLRGPAAEGNLAQASLQNHPRLGSTNLDIEFSCGTEGFPNDASPDQMFEGSFKYEMADLIPIARTIFATYRVAGCGGFRHKDLGAGK